MSEHSEQVWQNLHNSLERTASERDALRARVAELEAQVAEIPDLLLIAHMQGAEQAKDQDRLEKGTHMHHFHEDACEAVDASIFSGDILYASLDQFKVYLARWNRAVVEHEAAMASGDPVETDEDRQRDQDDADMPGGFPD